KNVTEITCHARGASILFPEASVVIDIGGQDSKVISVGAGGSVQDFVMNDKCAAGTGRFLQTVAALLGLGIDELCALAEDEDPCAITSMCAVFAETEIIGLLAKGTKPGAIASGVLVSIARRIRALVARIPLQGQCVFTGGLAVSHVCARMLERELNVTVHVPDYPQFVGALGAALIASDQK
ncbi:MAG: 2-hydroxyglutaryl-CoA dehydratase, partial [Desulfovibrio sp.]|nr:2-hydroxyglutaryl-CoA dehydratase [Desulfovibrio sp.]